MADQFAGRVLGFGQRVVAQEAYDGRHVGQRWVPALLPPLEFLLTVTAFPALWRFARCQAAVIESLTGARYGVVETAFDCR